jgi:hypothetical protein
MNPSFPSLGGVNYTRGPVTFGVGTNGRNAIGAGLRIRF